MADVAKLEIDVRARVGRAITSLARLNQQLRMLGNNQRQLAGDSRVLTITTNTLTRTTNNNTNATRRATAAHRGFRDELNDGQRDIMRFVGAVGRLSGGIMGLATVFAAFSAISLAPLTLGVIGLAGALLGLLGPVGLALGAFMLVFAGNMDLLKRELKPVIDDFKAWQEEMAKIAAPALVDFLGVLVSHLDLLTPLIEVFADALTRGSKVIDEMLGSDAAKNWFNDMADAAKELLPLVGTALVNAFIGFMALMQAFIPLGKSLGTWLARVTRNFAAWASTLDTNQGFQNFVSWLRTNGPTMISTLGNIVVALFKLLQALAPIGMVALKVFNDVATAIGRMDTATLTTVIVTILALVAAAKGFMIISGVVEIVMTLSAAFGALAGPVGIVVLIIASLIAQWVILWHTFEPFRQVIINGLLPAFQLLWSELKNLFDVITPIAPELFILVGIMNTTLILAITGVVLALAGIVRVVATVIEGWKRLFTATKNNWDKIKGIVAAVLVWFLARPFAVIALVVAMFIQNWNRIKGATVRVFNAIKNAIGTALNWIKDRAVSFKNTFLNGPWRAFTQGIPMLWRTAWNKVKDIFNSAKNALMDKVRNLKTRIVNFFENAGDWLYNAGKNIVQGLVDGITDKVGSAIDTVRGLAGDIKDAFTNPLDIFSPSRVFKGYGNNIVEGLTLGMDQARVMAPLMNQTMNLAQTVTAPFPTTVGAPTPAPMMAGTGTTTNAATYAFDFRGAVVTGGSKQVEDMVVQALSDAQRKGRVRGIR